MADTTIHGPVAPAKRRVHDFWNAQSCGEVYAVGDSPRARYEAQRAARYALEPYLPHFARFGDAAGRDVLEIGVGMGADHVEWARSAPRSLIGLDLTERAIAHTRERLRELELDSRLLVADAEQLPFADASFDLVYSWGVLHHSPDTPRAIEELFRVLRPGGVARVMIYHSRSIVAWMLWVRYALLAGRPWRTLRDVCAHHLESPGTNVYSVQEATALFAAFSRVTVRPRLSFGDLLEGAVGQRHRGPLLSLAKTVWPRWLVRRVFAGNGLLLLIEAVK